MTANEIDALNRDYEFVGFQRHFEPRANLVRFLLQIRRFDVVAWWWYLVIIDVPDMIYQLKPVVRFTKSLAMTREEVLASGPAQNPFITLPGELV